VEKTENKKPFGKHTNPPLSVAMKVFKERVLKFVCPKGPVFPLLSFAVGSTTN
jgi:hypothetical protein